MRPRWRGSSTIWFIPMVVTPSWRRNDMKRSPTSGSRWVSEIPSSISPMLRRAGQRPQPRPVAHHVGVDPVAVGLTAQRGDALAVIRGAQRLVVPDDVAQRDAVAAAQPAREAQRGAHLARVSEHVGVAVADVLDPDR